MTRNELLDRLERLRPVMITDSVENLDDLIEDVREEGVLDVQCPGGLPRPAK